MLMKTRAFETWQTLKIHDNSPEVSMNSSNSSVNVKETALMKTLESTACQKRELAKVMSQWPYPPKGWGSKSVMLPWCFLVSKVHYFTVRLFWDLIKTTTFPWYDPSQGGVTIMSFPRAPKVTASLLFSKPHSLTKIIAQDRLKSFHFQVGFGVFCRIWFYKLEKMVWGIWFLTSNNETFFWRLASLRTLCREFQSLY